MNVARAHVLLCGLLLVGSAFGQPAGPRFEVVINDSVRAEATTGRIYVALARTARREPRFQIGRTGVPFFGVDITGLKPGEPAIIDGDVLGSPVESLRDLPAGEYHVQACLNVYTRFARSDGHVLWMHMDQWEGQRWVRSPGNGFSEVQKVAIDPGGSKTIRLEITKTNPLRPFPADTPMVKRFRIQSPMLTKFWGHPIFIGATVLLPRGYHEHPRVRYPVIYKQGHFSTRAPYRHGPGSEWMADDFPRMLAVTLQHPTPYFDDSYAVNSANNGPYGDAIHQELIPEIERRFRAIPAAWARVLTGGSTGGWEAAALQIFYPDFYGGAWIFAPDPLDFRNVEGIDVYRDENAYYKQHAWRRVPTPNTRDPRTGEIVLTSRQRNHYELVHGTKGRSGQQLDIWSAVFGPVGEDGYFKPLFDKRTGRIDRSVAEHWREHYDLRHYLQQRWAKVGPKLVGKLHFFAGRRDQFYLNIGVEHMEDFLESTRSPYYGGTFAYGGRGGHGWSPFKARGELIRLMAAHVQRHAPAGRDAKRWRY
ncbi:MAG: hypothetical protein CMJ83_19280 [Planctomycetes bacterium]|nr:hypothetical protein [Planctomycetota bacterium]